MSDPSWPCGMQRRVPRSKSGTDDEIADAAISGSICAPSPFSRPDRNRGSDLGEGLATHWMPAFELSEIVDPLLVICDPLDGNEAFTNLRDDRPGARNSATIARHRWVAGRTGKGWKEGMKHAWLDLLK
jgi:hypothetical protein